MSIQVFAIHRNSFELYGEYTVSQVTNCIMCVYDIPSTELNDYNIELREIGGLSFDLTSLPEEQLITGRVQVFIKSKQ